MRGPTALPRTRFQTSVNLIRAVIEEKSSPIRFDPEYDRCARRRSNRVALTVIGARVYVFSESSHERTDGQIVQLGIVEATSEQPKKFYEAQKRSRFNWSSRRGTSEPVSICSVTTSASPEADVELLLLGDDEEGAAGVDAGVEGALFTSVAPGISRPVIP